MSLRDYLFHEEPGITLYCGDCREVLPLLEPETIVTDPVWPNAHRDLVGSDDPWGLFATTIAVLPPSVQRLCIWLGCNSDPRFLEAVPKGFPFLRMSYLGRELPCHSGRCLYTGDVLYCFGAWPPSKPGARSIPGENRHTSRPYMRGDAGSHPAARAYEDVRWVLKWWGSGLLCDPFSGAGTTLVAAKDMGLPAIGIEIEPKYCEITVKRLRQEVLQW